MALLAFTLIVIYTLWLVSRFFWDAWHHKFYWLKRGISGPTTKMFSGNLQHLGDFNIKPWVLTMHDWTKTFGTVYGLQKGYVNVLVVGKAHLAHEMIVTKSEIFDERALVPAAGDADSNPYAHLAVAKGARWKRLHAITAPAFNVANLKQLMPSIEFCVDRAMRQFQTLADKGTTFNIETALHDYTMHVIMIIALGRHEDGPDTELVEAVSYALKHTENAFTYFSWCWPRLSRVLVRFIRLLMPSPIPSVARVFNAVLNTVEERKARRAAGQHNEKSVDMIDLFLDCELSSNGQTGNNATNSIYSEKLTVGEIAGACFVFLLAGFDTTANTLTLTSWYLAKHPKVQETLRAEIQEVCSDAVVSYEQLNRLNYTTATIREVLRLNPIAAQVIGRIAGCNTQLGDIAVEKGTHVMVDTLSVHHDPDVWSSDAAEFRPERWLERDAIKLHNAFYGFGSGPRRCTGMRLALLEQKMLLVSLSRRFRIVATPETCDKLHLVGMILHAKEVNIKLEPLNGH